MTCAPTGRPPFHISAARPKAPRPLLEAAEAAAPIAGRSCRSITWREVTDENGLEHTRCNLCGAERPVPFLRKNGYGVVRCADCGLAYVSPRPNAEVLLRLYANEGYYRNRCASPYGYPDYLAERPLLEQLFVARIAEIEALRPRRGRLLDVGCATGVLLEVAGGRGWDVQGVDISDFSVAVCRERGLPVHHGDLVSARLPAASFDVAVLDDTIEHLPDPRREMEELHRVLAPGGLLTMNTPNEAGILRRLSGAHWFHLKPPEHLYYFSPRTLEDLLGRTGFRVFRVRTSGKFVTLRYLCERTRAFSDPLARMLHATLGRLPGARRSFPLPIGEFVAFAERL